MDNLELGESQVNPSMMQVHTPMKDLPPSLGFGSSSSPFFESPPTVGRNFQTFQWSPQEPGKAGLKRSSVHLLPSQFPPTGFVGLESSPPDAGRNAGMLMPSDHSASPQPMKMRRVGKRGRPRKYDININMDTPQPQQLNPPVNMARAKEITPAHGITTLPTARPLHTISEFAASNASVLSQPVRRKRVSSEHASPRRLRVYNGSRTSTGVPLFSSKVFELACQHQSDIRGEEASALREYLAKQSENRHRSQFSTHGMGFGFSINPNGKVSIDTSAQMTPTATPRSRKHDISKLFSPHHLIKEDTESDSEAEHVSTDETQMRTPPRFSSLGSCDAATAFAKSLARSNDRGQGFMFLFPPVSTPDKHGQLTSFVPCTPRTPRMAMPFDETSFSMQMQTPPGAIFSYENQGNMYATGMTPYLGSAGSVN